ncbi:cytochrome P450 family protein [Apiospora arundinis]|uniref:Cytochrome P450 family protein n=1 Tax=Apiospora arundinis TaxID=335852 RepID=A0ABR2IUY0_9PEZI
MESIFSQRLSPDITTADTIMAVFMRILALLISFIVYKQIRNAVRWRKLKSFGDVHGCGETITDIRHSDIDFFKDVVQKRYHAIGRNVYRSYNPFNASTISAAEPENFKAILATRSQDYELGVVRGESIRDGAGQGVVSAEGEAWVHYRQQLRPHFLREHISRLDHAKDHLSLMLGVLPKEDSFEVDILPLLLRFTLDTATAFFFGHTVNSQTGGTPEDMEFAAAVDYTTEFLGWRSRIFGQWYWVYPAWKLRRTTKYIRDWTAEYVQRALEGKAGEGVLLHHLAKDSRNPIELRDQCMQLILAGRDSTANTMCFMLLLLARHPAELAHLRRVVLREFGESDERLTFEALKLCKPLVNVLHETMRLYPVAPLSFRSAKNDTVLPVGGGPDGKSPVAVRKGELIAMSQYVMNRREDIWGPDAAEFRPSRWEGEKLGWHYIPFSGGQRICMGQQYALNEIAFAIVRILQTFDRIEPIDPNEPIKTKISFPMGPRTSSLRFHRAKPDA